MNNSNGQKNPQKEKILAQSRKASKDEGMENALNRGARLNKYYIEIVGFVLFTVSLLLGQSLATSAIVVLWFSKDIYEYIAKYRFLKQKKYLVLAIIYSSIAIVHFIAFALHAFLIYVDYGISDWWRIFSL